MTRIELTSSNTINKLSILLGLVLLLNINNSAYSQEAPLTTIGEPQKIMQPADIQSPFSTDATTDTDEETIPPADDSEEVSPFTIKADPDSLPQTDIKPVETQPQIENLQTQPGQALQSLIADPKNKLGLAYPFMELEKTKELIKNKDYTGAKTIVEPLTEWLTILTEYHIQLFQKLNNIDTAKNQAQVEKKLALDAALLRDKAYYQLALIYLGQNKEKEAVKYFVEVVKSQPKTELGMKSYEILQQIGFTEKIRLAN